MNQKRRLTRRESQEATRQRLIQAAEKAFIRYGFDASSVERIAEDAGYSRGAFYSNFRNKDELFVEVLKRKRIEIESALNEIFRRETDPARRVRGILDWYVSLDIHRGWIILETEFTLRAFRNRSARALMVEFNRQRIADYSTLVERHTAETGAKPTGRSDAVAISLFAAAKGMAEVALLETKADRDVFTESLDLIFKNLVPAAEEYR